MDNNHHGICYWEQVYCLIKGRVLADSILFVIENSFAEPEISKFAVYDVPLEPSSK